MAERIRTFWKGYLRLALVTIPVRMMPATRRDSTFHFHQVDRKSKKRIRYQKVVPGKGVVDKDDIVSGYEVEPGHYVLFEGDELNALKLETRHTIELTQFVDHCEIDPLYFDTPYYLLPDGDIAEEGYRVVRDALQSEKKVGIGQLTLRGKENLVALQASGAGILLDTLRYEEEIREADDIFADIGKGKVRDDMVTMAKSLIKEHSAPFDPTKYKNHYAEALRQLVQSRLKKGTVEVDADDEAPPRGEVVDFMEALKRSLGKGETKAKKADATPTPAEDAKTPRRRSTSTNHKAPTRRAATRRAATAKKRKAG